MNKDKIISCIDLTNLNDAATDREIQHYCTQAKTPFGNVAALCVYPYNVTMVKELLYDTDIKICTVANFPGGDQPFEDVAVTITDAMDHGADEIDVVFPYKQYLSGDKETAIDFIKQCRDLVKTPIILKVILETGALQDPDIIYQVASELIKNHVDFIKTSTGKFTTGATIDAVTTMLNTIKEQNPNIGIKISGGVRTMEQAIQYINLAQAILGTEWVTPQHFRLGASSLLDDILK